METVEGAGHWLTSHALLSLLSYTAQNHCLGVPVLSVGQNLPHHSLIKIKMPHGVAYREI